MSKNHHLGGKTKPAAISPPGVHQYARMYVCPNCEAIYNLIVHPGNNQVAIDCSCGALSHGIVRVSEVGTVISHNLSVECSEKLE